MNSTVCLMTNGCPENRIDGAGMQLMLQENGWTVSNNPYTSDLLIFNACALTEYSQESSIELIRNLKSRLAKNARLVVCGCLTRINPERLHDVYDGPTFGSDDFPALSALLNLGPTKQFTAANHLLPYINGKTGLVCRIRNIAGILNPYSLLARKYKKNYNYLEQQVNLVSPNYFHIKAATGCMNNCSYCAVKISRGELRSKPIEAVMDELRLGLDKGFKEFSIIGSDLGCYGRDRGTNLADLLRRMVSEPGDYRLKIRNVHPRYLIEMLPELAEILRSDKIDFLMTTVQSGNNRILHLMQRGYKIEDFKRAIRTLKEESPLLKIRTQIMVGFPGETEAEFEDSLRLIEELDFDFIECYMFSPRPGTKAASLPGRLSEFVLRRRNYRLIKGIVNRLQEKDGTPPPN